MSGHAEQNIRPDVRNSGFGVLTRLGPPARGPLPVSSHAHLGPQSPLRGTHQSFNSSRHLWAQMKRGAGDVAASGDRTWKY